MKIIRRLFGHRYYANIINTKGSDKLEICSFIFPSKEEAERHRKDIGDTASFLFIETVSFRSKKKYPSVKR